MRATGVECAVGDWVNFPKGDGIVIAEVKHRKCHHVDEYASDWMLYTDRGTVWEASVLEVRKP